jgi:UDP-2,4-diacetamido-2,4,6-trideoxy-beta-L-altropyranose hydrolase
MPQNTIVFRCDASPEIGTGHVMRCLSIADTLNDHGWEIIFFCSEETLITIPVLQDTTYQKTQSSVPGAYLLVDHYGLDEEYENSCRPWAKKIIVLDDLANRSHDCDLLVDSTLNRKEIGYKNLVPGHCKILTGPGYAPLRPQFSQMRSKAMAKRKGQLQRILLFISGTDPLNVTGAVLDALETITDLPPIDVALGNRAPHADGVAKKISASRHDITLHENVKNMAKMMVRADLAIGAGGTTSWERCCLGLPVLLIEIADNQAMIAKELEREGAAIHLGKAGEWRPKQLIEALTLLKDSPERLLEMSVAAAKICDGHGSHRIKEEIERL